MREHTTIRLDLDSDQLQVFIRVTVPSTGKEYSFEQVLDNPEINQSLGPLPEVHDLYSLGQRNQWIQDRRDRTEYYGRVIARAILTAIQQQDPK